MDTLPGVGPAIAAAIVRHRDTAGPFAAVENLMDVPGIGPAKLAALVDLVTVAAVALLLSLGSTLYPAYRAARLKPADVLKHE